MDEQKKNTLLRRIAVAECVVVVVLLGILCARSCTTQQYAELRIAELSRRLELSEQRVQSANRTVAEVSTGLADVSTKLAAGTGRLDEIISRLRSTAIEVKRLEDSCNDYLQRQCSDDNDTDNSFSAEELK